MTSTTKLFYGQNKPVLPHIPQRAIDVEIEKEIDAAARKIITTPMPCEKRLYALSKLLRNRAALLHHVPVCGVKDSVIFFNMRQIGLAPTPLCPAFNKLRLPTISSYHTIGGNIASVLLDPSAIQHVPKEALEKAGDLSEKQVDLFWTAVDGRPFLNLERPINLCTHPWSHPQALPGDDVKYDVNMGVFPEIGFQGFQRPGFVAFNHISPMQVHSHGSPTNMRYSPDNAHFYVIPDSPFGVLWTVTQKDNRVAFTKMLIIFDYNHPICTPLLDSIKNCDCLDTHLTRLQDVKGGIQRTLCRIIDLFEQDDPLAMEEFKKLPPAFQYGVFKEAWLLLDSPLGIHADFGKAAFENDASLKQEYHCSNPQRAQAVNQFATRLQHLLLDSQIELMFNSQSLVKGDNVLKMMQCSQLFQSKNENGAMDLFKEFSINEKEAVFFAMWELSGCPRGKHNFGAETFLNPITYPSLKADALLLAASRQTPQFDQLLVEAQTVADVDVNEEEKEREQKPIRRPAIMADEEEKEKERDQKPVERPVITTPPSSNGMSPQDVLRAMISLAFDSDLSSLESPQRKIKTMELFQHLPLETKNSIYGKVYEFSSDPTKGGSSWGEEHVADDLNALILALQEVLE